MDSAPSIKKKKSFFKRKTTNKRRETEPNVTEQPLLRARSLSPKNEPRHNTMQWRNPDYLSDSDGGGSL